MPFASTLPDPGSKVKVSLISRLRSIQSKTFCVFATWVHILAAKIYTYIGTFVCICLYIQLYMYLGSADGPCPHSCCSKFLIKLVYFENEFTEDPL